jgi:hypothetical protein
VTEHTTTASQVDLDGLGSAGNRPWRRGAKIAIAGFALTVVVAAGVHLRPNGREEGQGSRPGTNPLGTATVARTDLSSSVTFNGKLVYPKTGVISPTGSGTVTSLPRPGARLARTKPLLTVNGVPVGVFFGVAPLFRTLRGRDSTDAQLAVRAAEADLLTARAGLAAARRASGTSEGSRAAIAQATVAVDRAKRQVTQARHRLAGASSPLKGSDVAMVAENLADLGFYSGQRGTWTGALEAAVRRWQRAIGAPANGVVDPARTVVVRGPARVAAVTGRLGDQASEAAIIVSDEQVQVVLKIGSTLPAVLKTGRKVHVNLPNGKVAIGRVGAASPADPDDSGAERTVRVNLDDQPGPSHTEGAVLRAGAAVSVTVTTAARKDVLAVPVQALLALASGGYALQQPDGTLIAVDVGAIVKDQAEVTGPAVREGLTVVSAT